MVLWKHTKILVVFKKHLLLCGYFIEQRRLKFNFFRTLFQSHNKLPLIVPIDKDEYHQSTSYLNRQPTDCSCYQGQGKSYRH